MTRAGSDGRSSGRRSRPSRPPTIRRRSPPELGLGEERELSQTTSDMPATEFSGTRNGRAVALRMGVVPTVWRDRGANEVQVQGSVVPFQIREDDGRLCRAGRAL